MEIFSAFGGVYRDTSIFWKKHVVLLILRSGLSLVLNSRESYLVIYHEKMKQYYAAVTGTPIMLILLWLTMTLCGLKAH